MVLHKLNNIRSNEPVRESLTTCNNQDVKPELAQSLENTQLRDFIFEVTQDLNDLESYFNVKLSKNRIQEIRTYLHKRATELETTYSSPTFASNDQQAKVDFILIKSFIKQQITELTAQSSQLDEIQPLISEWTYGLVDLCERRQAVTPTDGKYAGGVLSTAIEAVKANISQIRAENFGWKNGKSAAYRAAQQLEDLKVNLVEWYDFYAGYDPIFTWWTSASWKDLKEQLAVYIAAIREHLVNIKPGHEDTIVGQPIGRDGILEALKAEFIPYSPEELIEIGEKQYRWCEKEAIKASREMGFGKDWKDAQEKVKNMYVKPGQQTQMVHELAQEAIDYVTTNDMVTIPKIARDYWRTYMMSPARQKVNPFFLGGESIIVSYPTDTMAHSDKLMVMRGNNRPFSRSTVFHELIPGHHLQWHYMTRFKTHRQLFQTPFWTEGWAFYWELILWDRGFPGSPENRLGMLFWHMHRCIRIIFSLNFHLGRWTPEQCIDALVDRVGHERATAEGEVRRSFNGDYGPLYQAGYMLGALQLYQLRKELVGDGKISEKSFHDTILKQNTMPIELLRALMKGEKLDASFEAKWRFYDLSKDNHR